jgi:hypothetical protein
LTFSRAALAGSLLLVLSLLFAVSASAATRIWDGGCGENTNWSCAANWSEDSDPGKGDVALFNGTSTNDAVVDKEFAGSVASVRIRPAYTGTISLGRSLSVLGPFNQAGGSFTSAGKSLTLKSLALSAGSFTASSGTTSISSTLKITGEPTFDANEGTVVFNGGGGTLTCDEVAFAHIAFAHTSGVKTVGPSCSLPLGEDPVAGSGGGGGITLNGSLSGSGTLTTFKKLTLGETGELSGFSGLLANALIAAGTHSFGEYEPFKVSGDFTLMPGASFTAPHGTASFGKNFTIGSGAGFDSNEGTIKFVSRTSFTLACDGQTFSSVVFESAGRKTIGSDCSLPLGASPSLGSGGTVLDGTLTGSGTLSESGMLEIGSIDPGLDSFADIVDNGALLLTPGAALTAPEGTLTVTGDFTADGGATFDANEGTVEFGAARRTTRSIACGEATFSHVVLANVGKQIVDAGCELPLGAEPTIGQGGQIELNGSLLGSGALTAESALLTLGVTGNLSGFSGLSSEALTVGGTYAFGAYEPFAVGGDFSITTEGAFTAPTVTASFAGNFSNGGIFEANGGTVELTGSNQELSGSTAFNDLTKIATASSTLKFPAGATQTVEGSLRLEGASPTELLSLVSSTPGTAWRLAGSGSRSAKWLSVADSDNTGTPISAVESTDGEKNVGWTF